MRSINECIKDLEKQLKPQEPDENEKSILELIDTNEDSEDDLVDLMDLEWRVRQSTPDAITTQKETPIQTSGSDTRQRQRIDLNVRKQ